MVQAFSNIDEELEKMNKLLELAEQFNGISVDKLFVGVKDIARALECSEQAASRFMNAADFPLIKIGKTPKVNVLELAEYTRQRIVMQEVRR